MTCQFAVRVSFWLMLPFLCQATLLKSAGPDLPDDGVADVNVASVAMDRASE